MSNADAISEIQKLAKIGYWTYDFKTAKFNYSRELMNLCLEEEYDANFNIEDFFNIVHEDDRGRVMTFIEESLDSERANNNIDFRINSSQKKYKYVKLVISKILDHDGNVSNLQGIVQEITELYESQKFLKINQDRIDFAIDTVGMGIWEWDIKNDITIVSPNIYKIANLPDGYIINQKMWNAQILEADREKVMNAVYACVNGESLKYNCDYRYKKPNGEIIWLSSTGAAVSRDANNVATNMIGIIFDVTKRKLAEEKLIESENRLKVAQHLTKLGNWEVNLEDNSVFWSDELYIIYGLNKKIHKPSLDLLLKHVYKDDLGCLKENLQLLYNGGKYIIVYKINTEDGKLKYIEEIAYSLRNSSGKIVKYIGTIQDITESKLAEEKIRLSEERLSEAQRIAKIGNWEAIPSKKTFYWSDEAYRIFGYEVNEVEVSQEVIFSHMFKADQEKIAQYIESLKDGNVHSITYRILANDGKVKYIKDTSYCKKDGNLLTYVGNIQDVTELELKQLEVVDSRERLKFAAGLAKLGYWEYYVDTQKLLVHELYSDSLDITVLGKNPTINDFLRLLEKEEKEKVVTAIRTMIKNGSDMEITICLKKSLGEVWLFIKGSCYYSNNNLLKLYGYLQDVTESHSINQDLIIAKERAEESDRLKSAFLANMSHEIRTPMNSIMGFSNLIVDDSYSIEEKKEYANIIQRNTGNLLKLITDILDLSLIETKEINLKYSKLSVNTFLNEFFIKEETNKSNLDIILKTLDNDIIINTDNNRLSQILSNFYNNAVKYTQEGYIEIGARLIDENLLSLYVKDTGIGIEKDFLEKIFNRFQKLNKFQNGMGLGLAVSKGLADLLNYKLKVESTLNKGSEFSIEIPLK